MTVANELNLPELPEGYRWSIQKNDVDPTRDSVYLSLEKLIQHWWGNTWRSIYSRKVTVLVSGVRLIPLVEEVARMFYAAEFHETESAKIAGIYDGKIDPS